MIALDFFRMPWQQYSLAMCMAVHLANPFGFMIRFDCQCPVAAAGKCKGLVDDPPVC